MGAFEDSWADFEAQAGPILADELSQQAPVSSDPNDDAPGTLAQSIDWEDRDGDTLCIGSRDPRGPIAAYVTRGTQPHSIDPVAARSLHFYVGGDEVFAQHVDHPGTTANPFHIAGWEAQRDAIHAIFMKTMGSGVTMAYLNPWRNRTLGDGSSSDTDDSSSDIGE